MELPGEVAVVIGGGRVGARRPAGEHGVRPEIIEDRAARPPGLVED
ncbi:hypothetical protein ABTZ99_25585 [Actinosynnema sp. NPDC002837]|jgi:siroheme synthase (precorrin-2 oxidase/ferrochelatase)